jgi:hypothetical protein
MEQSTRFVGMDVHKDTIVVAVTATGEVGKAMAYGSSWTVNLLARRSGRVISEAYLRQVQ